MYKKCAVTLLVFILSQALSFAQKPIAQYRQEASKSKLDSQKLNIYQQAFDEYKNTGTDSLKNLLTDGLELFDNTGYLQGRANLLLMLSGIYSREMHVNAERKAAEEALQIFSKLKDKTGVARSQINLGRLEGIQGNYDIAISYLLKALKHFESTNDTPAVINIYVKLGVANDYTGNYDKALEYYHKGLGFASATERTANTIFLYNNIGTTYARRGQLDSAKKYFEKALEYSSKKGFERARVSPLMNVGIIYREKGELQKAMEYHKQAMALSEELGMREDYAQALYNLGAAEVEINPENTQSLYRALDIAREIGDKRLQVDILMGMSDWAEGNRKYKEQIAFIKEADVIRDSLFNLDKAKAIANLQAEYELEKTGAQLAMLKETEKENRQKRNLYMAVAIALAAVLLTLFFVFAKTRRLNKELSHRQQELQDANMVKDRLFSIIGHDLKGPIGSIPVLLDIYKSKETGDDEKQFILDSLEDNAKASIETLDKLLNWGKLQIKGDGIYQTVCDVDAIMNGKMRLFKATADNKNITLINSVPAGTKVLADENQLKFILRNLMSNAIKFTNPGGKVEISAAGHPEGNMVVFCVKDNGIGIPKENQVRIFEPTNTSTIGTANESGTSIGLMLCKEFIRQNGGRIWVESEPGQGAAFYFTVKAV